MTTTETYISQEGDTVDLIVYSRFGAHGMEETVLTANPGLAALGPILPIGTRVIIPVPGVATVTQSDRLWS